MTRELGPVENGLMRWVPVASIAIPILVFAAWVGVIQNTAQANNDRIIDMTSRVDRLSTEVSDQRSQLDTICADLKEVETQFRASDQVRNLMHTNDLRIESMLWRKTFGADYAVGDPYLPTIAQEQPTPCR